MELRDLAKEAVLIPEDATFRDAIEVMVRKQTNSLLVINEEGGLVGEVNVADLLDAIIPADFDGDATLEHLSTDAAFKAAVENASDITVRDFMTTDIEPVHIDDSLLAIAATAIAHQTAHIPVVDHDERPIGFISRRGLKHIIAQYLDIADSP
jgi:CBS domain-containing protein